MLDSHSTREIVRDAIENGHRTFGHNPSWVKLVVVTELLQENKLLSWQLDAAMCMIDAISDDLTRWMEEATEMQRELDRLRVRDLDESSIFYDGRPRLTWAEDPYRAKAHGGLRKGNS